MRFYAHKQIQGTKHPHALCLFCFLLKKFLKNFVVSLILCYFAAERASCVPLCGASVPCLIGKIEALCSFLKAENVGNFQSLQKSFEEGSCATRAIP